MLLIWVKNKPSLKTDRRSQNKPLRELLYLSRTKVSISFACVPRLQLASLG